MAEGVGFEPTGRFKRPSDFESGTFGHSAIPPVCPPKAGRKTHKQIPQLKEDFNRILSGDTKKTREIRVFSQQKVVGLEVETHPQLDPQILVGRFQVISIDLFRGQFTNE